MWKKKSGAETHLKKKKKFLKRDLDNFSDNIKDGVMTTAKINYD